MADTFAFDVYGTLIDPHAIGTALKEHMGEAAPRFSQTWRDKQLEYSFRKGLMGAYEDFSVVTRQALDYSCQVLDQPLSEEAKAALMAKYRALSAFPDTRPALEALRQAGCRMFAFSNGKPDDLEALMEHAQVRAALDGIVSVHDVRSFKPDPKVYEHFCASARSRPADTWLVSSNPFDVIGANAMGWKTAWVQRTTASIFDPWGVTPTTVVASLHDLLALVKDA